MLSEGYDEGLLKDCEDNWIVIPRRYALDVGTWSVKQDRLFVDYEYLGYPFHNDPNKKGLHGWVWEERTKARIDRLIDETMTFQGSCWFMSKGHFERLGGMSEEGYGTFIGEAQEIGLKTWLGTGQVMVNKKVWYAHLWKGKPYRDAHKEVVGEAYTRIGNNELKLGNAFCIDYWMNNKWTDRKRDFKWIVEKFSPYPSSDKFLQEVR